jgi:hypothetical protein
MIARFILIVLVLTTSTAMWAQDPFKVLAVRGTVTVGGKGLAIGQRLKSSDRITVARGGYASLAHTNGRTVELRKEGTVKVSDLATAATQRSGSVSGKFASYVVGELTEVKEPIAFTDKRRANMRTTGSVERAAGDEVDAVDSMLAWVGGPGELRGLAVAESRGIERGESVGIIMPRHTRLLADTVTFLWHPFGGGGRYAVVITDREDRVVLRREVADTTLVLALRSAGVTENALFAWHVERADDAAKRSADQSLWLLGGADRDEALRLIDGVRSEIDPEAVAIGALILAQVYEDRGLMYDAWRSYQAAVTAAPDVQAYKRMFAEFLLRQNCNLEAFVAYQ